MKRTIYFLVIMFGLIACKSKSEHKPSDSDTVRDVTLDKNAIRKIDVHAHYRASRKYLPDLFKKWNMQAVLVDVPKEEVTGVARSWDQYVSQARRYPDLFFLCSSLIGVGIDDPDFAQRNIERLSNEIEEGARMVKVWKNFGMVTKDAAGNFIQIDDPRIQPIWDFLSEKEIPVIAHIGEPLQAWRPLNPKNPHFGYYSEHPEYHAYNHPEIPSYETIITARDRWIEYNPDLKILCAHLGSMSHDVDMVAERLDRFSNISVEPGARFGDLASQDSKKVRAFFEKYQDRIMFGSDYAVGTLEDTMSETELQEEQKELDSSYERLWNYLSGTDSLEIRGQKTIGLGLSKEVLQKVYFQNTADFLKLK